MPELCEVQIMTENLARWSGSKQLRQLEIIDQKLRAEIQYPDDIKGQTIQRVWRRAKYTILECERNSLVLHYRMTGKLVIEDDGRQFIRLRIVLSDGTAIVFSDPRRFGQATLLKNEEVRSYFEAKNLGDEPWEEGGGAKSGEWWQQRLGMLNNPIKPAMLRQDKVVGLGNILGSEICFRARIDPRKRASSVSLSQWKSIAMAAQSCITEILQEERSEEIGYVSQGSTLPTSFKVYRRNETPCSVCGGNIEQFTQQSRSTYWCPRCQQ